MCHNSSRFGYPDWIEGEPIGGVDCDDTLPNGIYVQGDCAKITWVKDADGDHWVDSSANRQEYINWNPEPGYIKQSAMIDDYYWGDCNDNDATKTDNCVDPCDNLKVQNNNTEYKAKIALLRTKTNVPSETGVVQKADGTFLDYIPTSDPNKLDPPPGTNFMGGIHTHVDPYETGKFKPDGINCVKAIPIPMFSPQDINAFLEVILNTKTNNIPIEDVYYTMVSSTGTYTLKFNGDIADVKTNINWGAELDNKFIVAKNENGLEQGFLLFLKDNIGINGISLYKINDDGTSEKKSLDANNLLQTTPCQ